MINDNNYKAIIMYLTARYCFKMIKIRLIPLYVDRKDNIKIKR